MTFNWIDSNTYFYIPIIIFCVIMTISLVAGFMNGWAVATYFLIGQLVFFAIGIGVYSFVFKLIEDDVEQLISKKIREMITTSDSFLVIFKSSIGFVFMFAVELISFLILGFFYIFFRKHLKKSHYIESHYEKPTKKISSRILGTVIAGVTGLMVAAPTTAVGYVFTVQEHKSEKNFLYNTSDKVVEAMSFGQYSDPMAFQRVFSVLGLVQDKDFIKLFKDFQSGNLGSLDKILERALKPENHDKIQSLLDNPMMLDKSKHTILSVVDKILGIKIDSKNGHTINIDSLDPKDPKNVVLNKVKDAFAGSKIKKFDISQDTYNNIIVQTLNSYSHFRDSKGKMVPADKIAKAIKGAVSLFANIK